MAHVSVRSEQGQLGAIVRAGLACRLPLHSRVGSRVRGALGDELDDVAGGHVLVQRELGDAEEITET